MWPVETLLLRVESPLVLTRHRPDGTHPISPLLARREPLHRARSTPVREQPAQAIHLPPRIPKKGQLERSVCLHSCRMTLPAGRRIHSSSSPLSPGISALTGLRTLFLITSELDWPVMDVIPLVRARGLRQLTLKYQHPAQGATATGGGTANPSALLARLDETLSGPAFSALEVFTFHVYASAEDPDDGRERWSREVDSHLPLCRRRGILVLRVSKVVRCAVAVWPSSGARLRG